MPKILLLGAPGVGKSTHSAKITKDFDIPAIATGDILRDNLKRETELGKQAKAFMEAGGLVPDELVIALIKDRFAQDDTKNGYLLDGFPRTIAQAEELDAYLAEEGSALDYIIYLNAPKEILVDRISGRRVCPECKAAFRAAEVPDGVCTICGEVIVIRKDDEAATVQKRIEVYNEQTSPLVDYYKDKGILVEIDASSDVATVQAEVDKALKTE